MQPTPLASTPPDVSSVRGRDGQHMRGHSWPVRFANFVKLPHTVFGLPFALVGLVFATTIAPLTASTIGWVLLAFTAARYAAMGFNRIVDRDIDAANPRTAARELPAGVISVRQAKLSVAIAAVVFVVAAAQLNPLCAWLSPLALVWICAYSYTKRFTRWSHLWLGLGLSIAPVGGYLAVTGAWSQPWWLLGALALVVLCWSAGFDTLYSLQDIEFDRQHALHSVPASFGIGTAIRIARALHVAAVLGLVVVVLSHPLGRDALVAQRMLWGGVLWMGGMLIWEHRLVRVNDLSRLNAAFFTMNGIIAIGYFLLVLAARASIGVSR